MNVTLIGIDCATQKDKVGLARGCYEQGRVTIEEVATGAALESVAAAVARWLRPAATALLALDAPLGWPAELGSALAHHYAGAPVRAPRDTMFRRLTDHVVERETGKRPLEVGADRIARTAHEALLLLEELRYETGRPIELAWDPVLKPGLHAIEVYPAATLLAHGLRAQGYKGARGTAAREDILRLLPPHLVRPKDTGSLIQHDHALDAVLCVLAGADFLQGQALPPEDWPAARREGWIWFRNAARQ